jgi:zinc D-Ala-D-Ala carboxypeptidase
MGRCATAFLVAALVSLQGMPLAGSEHGETRLTMVGAIHNLHPNLVSLLERLEARLGRPLTINSGYRDAGHNQDVGGVENSEHTYDPAEGVDVDCPNGAACYQIVTAALAEGVKRIGIGKNFVHIGISTDKPQNVIWNYHPKEKPKGAA